MALVFYRKQSMKTISKMTLISTVIGFILSANQIFADDACYPDAVYLVRHAEKMLTPGERDPVLTKQGQKRAQSLARILKNIKLDSIYSSQFKRTQQTVEPTASSQSLNIEIRNATATNELAEEVLDSCGERILISGHSNTIPALMNALGLKFEAKIQGKTLRYEPVIYLNEKHDYGTLFKVTFKSNGDRVLDLSVF